MRAKKSLGQHFLKSPSVVEKIIAAAALRPSDTVLEVGPGKGVLTSALLTKVAQVIAVEKDNELIHYLTKKFSTEIKKKQLTLLSADILDIDLRSFGLARGTYKIVANIPYYITGMFLRRFLSNTEYPESMTLLVQKEVADRILARDKKESLYSIGIKAYGTPRYIDTVKAGNFSPPPKVDSAILAITDISKSQFHNIDEEAFFKVLHAGFAHKRKQIGTNLGLAFRSTLSPEEMCEGCTISQIARAEDLTIANWKCLARYYQENKTSPD